MVMQTIARVDERTCIRRVKFKPAGAGAGETASRDALVCTTWTELFDGSLVVVSRSAADRLSPPPPGTVRGIIQVSLSVAVAVAVAIAVAIDFQ